MIANQKAMKVTPPRQWVPKPPKARIIKSPRPLQAQRSTDIGPIPNFLEVSKLIHWVSQNVSLNAFPIQVRIVPIWFAFGEDAMGLQFTMTVNDVRANGASPIRVSACRFVSHHCPIRGDHTSDTCWGCFSPSITKDELLSLARKTIHELLAHELDEHLTVAKVRRWDPHAKEAGE